MKNINHIVIISALLFLAFPFISAQSVPDWVKNTAGWWATDVISETEFVNAIEFLIKDNIIQIASASLITNSESVPDWVKNTAGWWATDVISETEFVNAIEFLVNVGIIAVQSENFCQNDLKIISSNQKLLDEICTEHTLIKSNEIIPYNFELNFNTKGFIGDDFNEQKPDDEFRILMVGGSTIFGADSSSIDTTIPGILQKMIAYNNPNMKINVINAGVSGATSITEYKLFADKLANYDPDIVIVYDGWNDLSSDYPVTLTKEHWKNMCTIGNAMNFDVMIFLQPLAGFGNKILTEQEKINSLTGEDHNEYQLLQAKTTYDYLARELLSLNDLCKTFDHRSVFDNVEGPIYWDQGHTSDVGNFILADSFLEKLSNNPDYDFDYDQKFVNVISKYNSEPIISFLLSELGLDLDYSKVNRTNESELDFHKGKYFHLKETLGGIDEILVGKDLRNVDLSKINLVNQDLTGANLSGHDLRDVDLTGTIIRGANLSDTNLEGKNLSGMDLRGINFNNANLKGVVFSDAVLSKEMQISGNSMECVHEDPVINAINNLDCSMEIVKNESIRTSFENADLTNSTFSSAHSVLSTITFTSFKNADLSNADLTYVNFKGCDFTDAILDNIQGDGIAFIGSFLVNAQMNNAQMPLGWFQSSSFYDVNLKNGNMNNSIFVNVNFKNADLDKTTILDPIKLGENNFNCKNNNICEN